MGFQDLMITPVYLMIFYGIAYTLRPRFTNSETRKYFIPALTLKFLGAICLGLIYQFYYNGGDTFNYFTHGSQYVFEAFLDSPATFFELLLSEAGELNPQTFKYTQKIWFYREKGAFFIIKLAGIFDILTWHTYTSTALFFAAFSFFGLWGLFSIFHKMYPTLKREIALATFFVPSLFFWGSGIMKDSITVGAIGFFVYGSISFFHFQKRTIGNVLLICLSLGIFYFVKVYVLLTLVPAMLVFFYLQQMKSIKNIAIKVIVAPFLIIFLSALTMTMIVRLGEVDARYAVSNVAETARITAYDIRYHTGQYAGSGYSVGELDGTLSGMFRLAPQAINVTLFRPYLWEASNPLMLLAALESLAIFILTIRVLFKAKFNILIVLRHPLAVFCLIFSITFAFAVGISTYNFGTLMRYKIPLIPFYLTGLFIIKSQLKSKKSHYA